MEENDRRAKHRFEMQRELRYKVKDDGASPVAGTGQTINISSQGVAFVAEHAMEVGAFIEISLHWPVLLDDTCPMRLNIFGRVLRTSGKTVVCSIQKHEFRTAPRTFQAAAAGRTDGMLERWAEGIRKGTSRETPAGA